MVCSLEVEYFNVLSTTVTYIRTDKHCRRLIIIIIMDICNAPTLRFKALNKHSITHIMYIEMENVISNQKKEKTTDPLNSAQI